MSQIQQMMNNNNNEKKEAKTTPTNEAPSTAVDNTLGINLLNSHGPWILDSGATHHIICTNKYYTHNIKVLNSFVQLPNEQTAAISQEA